jgi:putative ABC transport system substrate-binding protein
MTAIHRSSRRVFLGTLGAGLYVPLRSAAAQQAGTPTIGILDLGSAPRMRPYWDALRAGLRDLGYVDGQNIVIEYRSAQDQTGRLPALATELVALKVNVIVAAGTTSIRAARDASNTIPIVIAAGADPVEMGFAQTLARPGGNVTGLSILAGEINQKRLELLRQAAPHAKAVAFLLQGANPGNPIFVKAVNAAAQSLGLLVHPVEVRAVTELGAAFSEMTRAKADAVLVIEDPSFATHARELAVLALNRRLPTMTGNRLYVQAVSLMAYGLVYEALFRRAAAYVVRILKGANPAEMPIEQPTKYDLVINLKTAKALGLTIPPSLLARADQVIE